MDDRLAVGFAGGLAAGLILSLCASASAGPGGTAAVAAGAVAMRGMSHRYQLVCVDGRTSKVPVAETYGWNGERRNYGYEWVAFCEKWK